MQYTGLKDTNGMEIYEGDVVDDVMGNWVKPKIVEFNELSFRLNHPYEPRDMYELWIRDRLEVIGNIYENPELLESR